MIETIFDTLNAKAAIYAIEEVFDEAGERLPIWISGTITDLSGRTLTGQTAEAFWHSVRHCKPFAIGLNCALGAQGTAPLCRRSFGSAPTRWSARIPMPACPTNSAVTTNGPESMAATMSEFARAGLVNIVGGCCGTTPAHIAAFGEAIAGVPPRAIPEKPRYLRLSGLEPFTLTPDTNFVNIGERTNITGSAKFRKLIAANDYEAALDVARGQVESGAQIIDVNMDEGLIDSEAAMRALPEADRGRAGHRARAGDDRFLQMERDRGGAEMRAGQMHRQFHQPEGRRGRLHRACAKRCCAMARPSW